MGEFFKGWRFWTACAILLMASVMIACFRFPQEFWTPQTVLLVSVTSVLCATLIAVVGLILIVVVYFLWLSVLRLIVPVKHESFVDDVFGELRRESWRRESGIWDGTVPFYRGPTGMKSLDLFIDAGEGQPTAAQRDLFREIEARYSSMWPEIAQAFADQHASLKTVEAVTQHLDPSSLIISPVSPGEPLTWTFHDLSSADMADTDSAIILSGSISRVDRSVHDPFFVDSIPVSNRVLSNVTVFGSRSANRSRKRVLILRQERQVVLRDASNTKPSTNITAPFCR